MFRFARITNVSLWLVGACASLLVTSVGAQSRIEFSPSSRPSTGSETAPPEIKAPSFLERRGAGDAGESILYTPPSNNPRRIDRNQQREFQRLQDQRDNWVLAPQGTGTEGDANAPDFAGFLATEANSQLGVIEAFIIGETDNGGPNSPDSNASEDNGFFFGGDSNSFAENSPFGPASLTGQRSGFTSTDQFFQNQITGPVSRQTGFGQLFENSGPSAQMDNFGPAGLDSSLRDRISGPSAFGGALSSGLLGDIDRPESRRGVDSILGRDDLQGNGISAFIGGSSLIGSMDGPARGSVAPVTASGGPDGLNVFDAISNPGTGVQGAPSDLSGTSVIDRMPTFGQSSVPFSGPSRAEPAQSPVRSLFEQGRRLEIPGPGF